MALVAIVQPYVPNYRVPLFDRLGSALAADGHDLRLVTGTVDRIQRERRDEAPLQEGQVVVRTRSFRAGPVRASWKRVGPAVADADLVIAQMGAGVLETNQLLMRRRRRVATFGHGYATTGRSSWPDGPIERWQLRRSDHAFVYTERGRTAALDAGVDDRRITVVGNTIDTTALLSARRRLVAGADEIRARYGLGDGPVCVYIGGLDRSKRIDVLLESARALAETVDGFRLVVAGDGVSRADVESSARAGGVVYVGPADDDLKAELAQVGTLLLNPGRVGLVAVDSFALELPIVTTEWPHHAPEFEYLEHDRNAVITADDLDAFVEATASVLGDAARVERLREGCRASCSEFSIEAMVERFRLGIRAALDDQRVGIP